MNARQIALDPVEAWLLAAAQECQDALATYAPAHMPERMNGRTQAHYVKMLQHVIASTQADMPRAPNRVKMVPVGEFVTMPSPTGRGAWQAAMAHASAHPLTVNALQLRKALQLAATIIDFTPDYMHGEPRKHYRTLCDRAAQIPDTLPGGDLV